MWKKPWLNRDCLELPPQSARSQHTKQHLGVYVSPTPQGPGQRAERGTRGPKYSVSTPQPELASSSTPATLPLPTYCLGLVSSWPLFVCNISFLCSIYRTSGHSLIYHLSSHVVSSTSSVVTTVTTTVAPTGSEN